MSKLVIFKIAGSFEQGFSVTLQIGEESDAQQRFAVLPTAEVVGNLPPNLEISQSYHAWQSAYRRLGLRSRLNAPKVQFTNVSLTQDCDHAAQVMNQQMNDWLRSEPFRPIREKWLEQLKPDELVRVILQSENAQLQRLPWHLWEVLERYSQAEVALSLPTYDRVTRPVVTKAKIKILAILGNSQGIDVQADRALLDALPDADVRFLVEPERQTLNEQLWLESWDILFFAGHSVSTEDGSTGTIKINQTDGLTVSQAKYALKKAVERGLQLAIFNSCDGLGLARDLADLDIPQMIVMREPVPDHVAQIFLKSFLTTFSQGQSFYLSVREARERLQGLEDQFPCATWLPIICQNLAEPPLTWQGLSGQPTARQRSAAPENIQTPQPRRTAQQGNLWRSSVLRKLALCSLLTTFGMIGLRSTGLLQPLELNSFDALMRLRPIEELDHRLLIVTVNAEEQQKYGEEVDGVGWVSVSDRVLNQLLQQLTQAQVSLIGLDLYRDFPVSSSQPTLRQQYQQNQRIVSVCKARFSGGDSIAPPPDLPLEQLGFSDFVADADETLRRHLLTMTPDLIDVTAPCTAAYGFSSQLALRYLTTQGFSHSFTPQGELQIGQTIFHLLKSPRGAYQRADTSGNQILLNYRANQSPARQVTLTDMLSGQVNPAVIQDRIVLIGIIAPESGDIWKTPIDDQTPGVVMQAHMVSQILSTVLDNRSLIQFQPLWIDSTWIGVWAIVGAGLGWQARQRLLMPVVLLSGGMLAGICWAALIGGIWLPLVPAGCALLISSSAMTMNRQWISRLQSRRLPNLL